MTVVVEEVVFATGDLADLAHVLLDDFGNSLIVLVASFAVLEEYVAVLGHTASNGSVGSEGARAELCEGFAVEEGSELILLEDFDLLDLVACAEAVEEVNEGNAALDSSEVSYSREVHNFLNRSFAEHGATCLACSHNVEVVAEDRKCVRGDSTSRYVEYAGE